MRKKITKIILISLGVIVVGAGLFLLYLKIVLPDVGPPPEIQVVKTAENIERGRYLANHVMVCMDCHSERDWSLFSGPPKPGTHGSGGEVFDQRMGFPGKFVARNITPARLSSWTDGEIFRAITSGVSKDGSALFNIMPYHHYGDLDEDDIRAVIAYLRTLDPIEHKVPESKADFPMNFIINTLPKEAELKDRPPKTDRIKYGEYMVTAGACFDCHTKMEKGKFVGEPFAGGMEFEFPDGSVLRSANITPHTTGIGNWSKEQFVQRFKMYADSAYSPHQVKPGEFQTMMPWMMYAGMTTEDLEAIYAYLQTVDPVDKQVSLFTPAGNSE